MTTANARRPSPLQRQVLIVLAAMEQRGTHPVRTRDLEHLLAQGGDAPVYGPNLQLAVELTDAGRDVAEPLLTDEQARAQAEQRTMQVVVLPLVRITPNSDADKKDRPVQLDGNEYIACRGDYVIRLNGSTCLQLWNTEGQVARSLTGCRVVTVLSRCGHRYTCANQRE